MALPSYARNAKTPQEHHEVFLDLLGSGQGRGIPASMMAAMRSHSQLVKNTLSGSEHAELHQKISRQVDDLTRDDEISDEEAKRVKNMYAPTSSWMKEGKDMDLKEKMSEKQMAKREEMVKSMKKNFASFKTRYGDRAKDVMYATATKQAMKSEEVVAEDITRRKFLTGVASFMGGLGVVGAVNQMGKSQNLDAPNITTINGEKHKLGVPSLGARLDGKTSAGKYKIVTDDKGNKVYAWRDTRTTGRNVPIFVKKYIPVEHINKQEGVAEDQHYCAKHVYSEVFGEGLVVEGQHAEPDENGNIEWYTVQFEHGEEVIFTEDVEIMIAEYHANHSPAKKKKKAMKAA